jgi:hypothetical protein
VDKFSGYVIWTYLVTFGVLVIYLGWLWWKLRQERADQGQGGPRQ